MEEKKLTGYPSIDKPWLKYFPGYAEKYTTEHIPMSAYSYMKSKNAAHPEYIALEYFGRKISYSELFHSIHTVALALKKHNIQEGDYITLCLPNIPEMVYFIYAINSIGAAACLIDPRTNTNGILERVNDSGSKILVVIADIVAEKIDAIKDLLKTDAIVVVSPADSASCLTPSGLGVRCLYMLKGNSKRSGIYMNYKSFISQKGKGGNAEQTFSENRPAIVVYTSGTTGTAKGVVLTNENMIAATRILEFGKTYTAPNEGFLGCIPFFSAYGAMTGMHYSLCCGWKIVLIPKYKPSAFGKLLRKHRTASALGVPRFWDDFADEHGNGDLAYLVNAISGGDKIAPATVDKVNSYLLANKAHRLKVGYGASEFGGGIVVTTDNGSYESGSVGEILPGVIGMVIDPDTGEELSYDLDGELCFYSPTMMREYLNCPEETTDITIFKHGVKYYRTGDKGHISKNGSVTIVDRYKRVMMRPDGHTVHASPIENAIMTHSNVQACAVVGLPLDDQPGVIPTAFIVLKDTFTNHKEAVNEISTICLRSIPERDCAHAFVITEKLPYTPMGKVDYRMLEKLRFSDLDYVVKDSSFLRRKDG